MPTISRINDRLLWFKPEISIDFGYFSINEQLKFHAQLSWERKKFYNLGARSHKFSRDEVNAGLNVS